MIGCRWCWRTLFSIVVLRGGCRLRQDRDPDCECRSISAGDLLQPARCVPPDRYPPMCPPGTLSWELGGCSGCVLECSGCVPGVFWGCSGAVLVVFWGNPPRIRLEHPQKTPRTPPEHTQDTPKTHPEHPPNSQVSVPGGHIGR